MKKSILALLAILFLFGATSCDLRKIHERKCQKWGVCTQKDSMSTVQNNSTSEKDSLIGYDSHVTDPLEMFMSFLFKCDSLNQVHLVEIDSLKTDKANYMVSMHGDTLIQKIFVPGDTIYIPKIIKIKSRITENSKYSQKTITVISHELTRWQAVQIWCGRVLLLCVLIAVIWFVISASKWFASLRRE